MGLLWGCCGVVPHSFPVIMENNPYAATIGMKLRVRKPDSPAFAYHKTDAAPPIFKNFALIQNIGDNQVPYVIRYLQFHISIICTKI